MVPFLIIGIILTEIFLPESILYFHWISIALWSIEMIP